METIIAWFTLQKLASIITILAAVGVFTARGRNCARKLWNRTLGYHTYILRKHINSEEDKLADIMAELRPNGGSSLRDAVDRVCYKLAQLEAMSTASFNVHDVAIFRTDLEGRVIYTNRAHQRLTGFSYLEMKGEGWINALHPSERTRLKEIWHDAVRNGRELNEDILFITPDHQPYKVRAHVYREVDSEGKILGYLGVIHPLVDEETIFNISADNN